MGGCFGVVVLIALFAIASAVFGLPVTIGVLALAGVLFLVARMFA